VGERCHHADARPAAGTRPTTGPAPGGPRGIGHVGVFCRAVARGRQAPELDPERSGVVDPGRPGIVDPGSAEAGGPGGRRRDLPAHALRDARRPARPDRGWTLAAAAEDKPVESHTLGHGLPVRKPGARLVPGTANGTAAAERDQAEEEESAANGGSPSGGEPQHAATARDPEAVRASFSSHFRGVRTGRSHARDNEGSDQE
jgi:hypothetical protein